MPGKLVGDARFYVRSGPFGLAEVAAAARGTATARSDRVLTGIAPLQAATPGEVSFLDNKRYAAALEKTGAGAVIVHPDMVDRVPPSAVAIVATATYEGWARVAALFHPAPPSSPGIHPTAFVAPGAVVDPTAEIGAFAYIEERAQIGPGCRIGPYASVGSGVVIGKDCRIGAHVSLSHALLGARVCLHPGVRVGQEGFSFARTKTGFLTIPQLGRVVIEDDVEVGANSTIDRGSVPARVLAASGHAQALGPPAGVSARSPFRAVRDGSLHDAGSVTRDCVRLGQGVSRRVPESTLSGEGVPSASHITV